MGYFTNFENFIVQVDDEILASDLNNILNELGNTVFPDIANDTNLGKIWAVGPGDPPNAYGQIEGQYYSAKGHSLAAESWSSQPEDEEVIDEGGNTVTGKYSALHWGAKTNADKLTTQGYMNTTLGYRDEAEGFKDLASDWATGVGLIEGIDYSSKYYAEQSEFYATQASGENTFSAGANIVINTTGTGPFDNEVSSPNSVQNTRTVSAGSGLSGGGDLSANRTISHADTSSQGSVNNSGATVIQDVTLDTYGHTTGLASKTLSYSDVGAAASSHSHSYVPLSGGTMSGTLKFSSTSNQIRANNNYNILDFTGAGDLVVGNSSNNYTVVQGGLSCSLQASGWEVTLDTAFDPNSTSLGLGSSGQKWKDVWAIDGSINTSDETLKIIGEMGDLSWMYELEPISFRWKDRPERKHFGFSAQQVYEKCPKKDTFIVHPAHEIKDRDGNVKKDKHGKNRVSEWGFAHHELIAPMFQLIKDQKQKIDELEARLVALEV